MMTMNFSEILKIICTIMTMLLSVCYFYQVIYLILPLFKKKTAVQKAAPRRYAILIAARNEEKVLPYLLDSIAEQDYPSEMITTYVVADNCTDETAEVAKAHGARVFTRFSTTRIGKGYALHDLLERIRLEEDLDAYDAFLIFDADNLLKPDYVSQINQVCGAGYEAFCGYRNTKNFGENWLSAGYGVWYLHDSAHLNQSRMMLGTSCAVSGTGFGFTRELLNRMGGWNFFTLTEDIEFSTWCATHGVTIGYCHDAVLYDEQPSNFGASWKQRTRWTQGGIQIAVRYWKDLLQGFRQGGKAAYATFETATLSMWGVLFSCICGGLTMLNTFLQFHWTGVAAAVLMSLVCAYLSAAAMGALTVISEWNRILAGTKVKIGSIFAFPLFLLTFIPIAATAVFRKFRWQPTKHTVAISTKRLYEVQ